MPVTASKPEIEYPDSDGQPMADNTRQFQLIVTIQGGLDHQYRDEPDVFVAGDLLIYPVEGDNKTRIAPDVFVAFGRPKGHRGSYRVWEEAGIFPQVVFEVLSPGNRVGEMSRKFAFYEKYGADEYIVIDPEGMEVTAWKRDRERLQLVDDALRWTSPRLGIRFDLSGEEFKVIGPDGQPFRTFVELAEERDQERQRAETERKLREATQADLERLRERVRKAGLDANGQ